MISCLPSQGFAHQSRPVLEQGVQLRSCLGFWVRIKSRSKKPKYRTAPHVVLVWDHENIEPRTRPQQDHRNPKKVGPNRFTVENIKFSRHNCTIQFVCQKSCCMPSKMTTHYRFHLRQYQTEIVYDSTNKTNIKNCFLRAILIFNNLAQHNFRRMSF